MRNRGKRAALVLLLLGALLLLSGCVQEDLSIVGVEPGQPGPESGQLRILFAMNSGSPPSPTMTIDDVSLSKVSFTITNEDTNELTVVTNPTIDQDPAISYARFDAQGKMIEHQLGILIPYTLKPGRYRVTDVKGDVLYPFGWRCCKSFSICKYESQYQLHDRGSHTDADSNPDSNPDGYADSNPDGYADSDSDGCADSHACADPSARSENSDARKRGLHGKYGEGEPDSAYRRRHFRVRRGELPICIRGRQSA